MQIVTLDKYPLLISATIQYPNICIVFLFQDGAINWLLLDFAKQNQYQFFYFHWTCTYKRPEWNMVPTIALDLYLYMYSDGPVNSGKRWQYFDELILHVHYWLFMLF